MDHVAPGPSAVRVGDHDCPRARTLIREAEAYMKSDELLEWQLHDLMRWKKQHGVP